MPLGVSHFSPTLEQFLMIAILCIDLLYSCARRKCRGDRCCLFGKHNGPNNTSGDTVLHIKPTLALRAVSNSFYTDIYRSALGTDGLLLTCPISASFKCCNLTVIISCYVNTTSQSLGKVTKSMRNLSVLCQCSKLLFSGVLYRFIRNTVISEQWTVLV